MKRYRVAYDPQSLADMDDIFFWLAEAVSLPFAKDFTTRLKAYCDGLEAYPLRSPIRDEIRPGLRVVVFEKCVSVGYGVADDEVRILRFLYRGRSLAAAFEP